ncbi:hypothetical protein F8M41_011303 [Gigaspora margarita]|uniref:Uncharacterized protein n=1 Tax=Gigaspora margarita TaxID=4874 RepID=A0A8H3X082_GIGMA|nr:hypothetical protein F8M41_011303 [Gigaspora margarita]
MDYNQAKRRLFIPRYISIFINALAICFVTSKFIVFCFNDLPSNEIIEAIELTYAFILALLLLLDIFLLASDSIIENKKRLLNYYKLDITKGILTFIIASMYSYYLKHEAYHTKFFDCNSIIGCEMNIINLTIIWLITAYYLTICQLLWFLIKKPVQNITEASDVGPGNPFLSVFHSSRDTYRGMWT